MALTEKQKKQLEKLDLSMGGGFYNFASNVHKAEMQDDKFLFVGLGGRGGQTIAALKTAIKRQIRMDEGAVKPDNVEYLTIDSAQNDLDTLCQRSLDNVGLDPVSEVCRLYSAVSGAILKKGPIPDYIEEWINPKLNAHLDGSGANGIRQASRFLLFSADGFNRVENSLKSKLSYLQNINNGQGRLLVYVIAGISGGTGSGSFIDIPYIIRQICENNGYKVNIEAYLYLPDSYPIEADNSTHLKYNAYAALKELDFYMSLADRRDTYFDAVYSGNWKVHSNSNIYNVCNLITGSIMGSGRKTHPMEFSQQVVIDHIMNLITRSETDPGVFLIDSFLDNDQTMIAGAVANLPNTVPRDSMYCYNVIGIGAVTLPFEQILSYISKNVMDRIVETWDNRPESNDVDQFIQTMNMYPSSQFTLVMGNMRIGFMPYQKKMLSPSKEDCINGTTDGQIKGLWMQRSVEFGQALDGAVNEVLSQILKDFNVKLKNMMIQPEKGLFYCLEFLDYQSQSEGRPNGLIQRMRTDLLNEIDGLIGGAGATKMNIRNQQQMLKNKMARPFTGGLVENYIELSVAYCNEDSKIEVYLKIKEKLLEFIEYVEKQAAMYRSFADSFYGIKEILEKNFSVVMAGRIETAEYRVKLLDFSRTDEQTRQIVEYLDDLLDKKNFRSLVSNLAACLLDSAAYMLNDGDYNPMKVYTRFIEDEFQDIPNATIEKMILLKYGEADFDQGVMSICRALEGASKVIFDPIPTFPLQNMSSVSFITAPRTATDLINQIERFASANNVKVAKSSDMNSIIWYNLYCGVPLSAISKISDYEDSYEKSAQPEGMHLSESGKQDWKKFSNLSRINKISNPREEDIIREVNENTEKMLAWGIVEEIQGIGNAAAYTGHLIDRAYVTEEKIGEFVADYNSNPANKENDALKRGRDLYLAFWKASGGTDIDIFMPTVYEEKSVAGLKRMMRLNWLVYLQLKDMMEYYPILESRITSKNRIITFFDMYVAEMLKYVDGFYILSDAEGNEKEILYVEELHGMERDYELYYAFIKFVEKVSGDMIEDLSEELKKQMKERSKSEIRRSIRGELAGNCDEKLAFLKTVKAEREFGKARQSRLYGELKEFYTNLKALC